MHFKVFVLENDIKRINEEFKMTKTKLKQREILVQALEGQQKIEVFRLWDCDRYFCQLHCYEANRFYPLQYMPMLEQLGDGNHFIAL